MIGGILTPDEAEQAAEELRRHVDRIEAWWSGNETRIEAFKARLNVLIDNGLAAFTRDSPPPCTQQDMQALDRMMVLVQQVRSSHAGIAAVSGPKLADEVERYARRVSPTSCPGWYERMPATEGVTTVQKPTSEVWDVSLGDIEERPAPPRRFGDRLRERLAATPAIFSGVFDELADAIDADAKEVQDERFRLAAELAKSETRADELLDVLQSRVREAPGQRKLELEAIRQRIEEAVEELTFCPDSPPHEDGGPVLRPEKLLAALAEIFGEAPQEEAPPNPPRVKWAEDSKAWKITGAEGTAGLTVVINPTGEVGLYPADGERFRSFALSAQAARTLRDLLVYTCETEDWADVQEDSNDREDPRMPTPWPPEGWKVGNPDWPAGDGPHLVREDET